MVKCVSQNYLAALPSIRKCGKETAVGIPVLVKSSTNAVASAESLACIEPLLDRLVQILLLCRRHSHFCCLLEVYGSRPAFGQRHHRYLPTRTQTEWLLTRSPRGWPIPLASRYTYK
jgi:hypothetical protein